MKLQQKGFLLVQLSRETDTWDYELIRRVLTEYGMSGRHSINTVRIALDELAAGGLIAPIEQKLDDGTLIAAGTIRFRYKLTHFGRERMQDTGLLPT